MIKLDNISFSYHKTQILYSVSTEFAPGLLYGIIGPNGCGKTTLIRILAGLNYPSNGSVSLDDKTYNSFSKRDLAKSISLMPQIRRIPEMTVCDFVSCGRYPYLDFTKHMSESDNRAVETALRKTDTISFAHRKLSELSGGERQRVYLAMLLAQDTKYILLDEPSSFLDIANEFSLMELLTALKNEGKCVIAVMHELSLALKYCDKILVMENGRLAEVNTPENTLNVINRVFNIKCEKVKTESENFEYVCTPNNAL